LLKLGDHWADSPDKLPLLHGTVSEHKSAYLYGESVAKKKIASKPRGRKPPRRAPPSRRTR
jgi:hypothetical protein